MSTVSADVRLFFKPAGISLINKTGSILTIDVDFHLVAVCVSERADASQDCRVFSRSREVM